MSRIDSLFDLSGKVAIVTGGGGGGRENPFKIDLAYFEHRQSMPDCEVEIPGPAFFCYFIRHRTKNLFRTQKEQYPV